ncbi:MAG: Maf family protein [Fimbriimonadaceae bacterium]|nr:Maf family protein [Fimbriimonadaceae bacterium]
MLEFPWPVVLASASPRRRELLAHHLAEFDTDPAEVDEDALTCADPWETARCLADAKAEVVASRHTEALVIAGDTVVALEEGGAWEQLAKPADVADARAMLARLSGREHVVITAVALRWPGGRDTFVETSRVRFRALAADEIEAYTATGEPMDKAGAYAIQGGAAAFAEVVEGEISTVIGLPIEELLQRLSRSTTNDKRQTTNDNR